MPTKSQRPVKKTPLITRIGNIARRTVQRNPNVVAGKLVTEALNRGAVATKSEGLRNLSAIVTGLLRIPEAAGNRLNAGITAILPEWTEEKVVNPRNTWTIDKTNHLARYMEP